MALILKSKYQVSTDGTTLRLINVTGAYDPSTNPGGFGTPNPELSDSALIALILRRLDDTDTPLVPISNQILYDNGALNSDEAAFDFTYLQDGHHMMYLFRLPVSLDGIVTVEGPALVNGNYFYWNNGDVIWKMEGGTAVPVTDLTEMIDNPSITQKLCEDLIFIKLTQKFNEMYQDYREKREDCCDGLDALFQELQMFRLDLIGAKMSFKSDLVDEAEDIIESLIKKYNV